MIKLDTIQLNDKTIKQLKLKLIEFREQKRSVPCHHCHHHPENDHSLATDILLELWFLTLADKTVKAPRQFCNNFH